MSRTTLRGPIEAYLATSSDRRTLLSTWTREGAKALATKALVPLEIGRARRLEKSQRPLKLHLGVADNYLQGWVNIDLFRPGRQLDLRWDLRRPLPFSNGAADAIFAGHLFEHIDLKGAFVLLRECWRVCAADAVLRIGVPDLGRYVRAYGGEDSIIDDCRPGRPTRGIALSEVFFCCGHRSMYDFETLEGLLVEAGFSTVERCEYGLGRIYPNPDGEHRRLESLYVEAIK